MLEKISISVAIGIILLIILFSACYLSFAFLLFLIPLVMIIVHIDWKGE